MEFFNEYGTMMILVAAFFGFIMAFGIGANDVANAMGTSVGSKVLTIKQAIVIAMIFEFAGAYLAGGEVTSTIKSSIIDPSFFADVPHHFIFGMIASLLAAGIWLLVASYQGWPVSTTHSIIGAIIGFALVSVGPEAVSWGKVSGIVGSWVITPVIAGIISYLLFISAQRFIFNSPDPLQNAKRYVPVYMFLVGFVMSLVTITKGLKHVGIHFEGNDAYWLSFALGVALAIIGRLVIARLTFSDTNKQGHHFDSVERIFSILMVMTACAMAFAHGSNDVANAIGPLAAVVSTIQSGGEIASKAHLAWWVLPLGAFGICFGLGILGKRVMATIGEGITHLTPSRGFAAELAAASTVVIASGTGLPISTTQTLVGAVLGVGLARGIAALNLGVIRTVVISWVVTLPAGALLSIVIFVLLEAIFL